MRQREELFANDGEAEVGEVHPAENAARPAARPEPMEDHIVALLTPTAESVSGSRR